MRHKRLSKIGVYIALIGGYLPNDDTFEIFDTLKDAKDYIRELRSRYEDKFIVTTPYREITHDTLAWFGAYQVGYWQGTNEEIVITANVVGE